MNWLLNNLALISCDDKGRSSIKNIKTITHYNVGIINYQNTCLCSQYADLHTYQKTGLHACYLLLISAISDYPSNCKPHYISRKKKRCQTSTAIVIIKVKRAHGVIEKSSVLHSSSLLSTTVNVLYNPSRGLLSLYARGHSFYAVGLHEKIHNSFNHVLYDEH